MKKKKPKKNPLSEANIRRIDTPVSSKKQLHGWQVHFIRLRQITTKFFADHLHGGKDNALKKARKWRDATKKELPAPLFRAPYRTTDSRNRTGIIGVSLREKIMADGTHVQYVSASVRPAKNRGMNKQFPVVKGNTKAALEAAKKWRTDILRKRLKAEGWAVPKEL